MTPALLGDQVDMPVGTDRKFVQISQISRRFISCLNIELAKSGISTAAGKDNVTDFPQPFHGILLRRQILQRDSG